METSTALKIFRDYQKSNLKPSTVIGFSHLINNFEELFGGSDLMSISSEDILHFLELITENSSKSTKRRRYSQLRGFFNFIMIFQYPVPLRQGGSFYWDFLTLYFTRPFYLDYPWFNQSCFFGRR